MTTTKRLTKPGARRNIDAAMAGLVDAEELLEVLSAAIKANPDNGYIADATMRAASLVTEMAENLSYEMDQASAAGFLPEDFE